AVALAFRPQGYPPCYHLGRETYLCPVEWKDDGFPVLGDAGHLLVEHKGPPQLGPAVREKAKDDFESDELAPKWNYLRKPDESMCSLSERPGYLRLRGSKVGLDEPGLLAWIGRRQCHFNVK